MMELNTRNSFSMEKTIIDTWDDPNKIWPTVTYIETTNQCNANCLCCLNDRCQKPRGTMSLKTFKKIVSRLKKYGLVIHAMFCFGEPLLDPTLTEKYAYAESLGCLRTDHCGLNTNVSHLTPEKYEGIFRHTPNITLSFFNTEKEFERLTNLNWNLCYKNALDFIAYRNEHYPNYSIAVGVNTVKGHNLENVKKAFRSQRVNWVQDREIRWRGSVITGVIDRTIMYNTWLCDGYKGALQIKFDGSCEFCAYDVIGSKEGGETHIGNILTDSLDNIRDNFKRKWREPCTLCKRCDYWYCAKQVFANNYNRPNPLPADWYDWQKPFLKEGEQYID